MAGARAARARRARAKRAAEAERLRSADHSTGSARRATLDWQLVCKAAAACFLVSAALIHAIWTALHFQEGVLTGAAFLLAALAQSALAFGLLAFPGRGTYLLTIALSLGIAALWALSRTVGLPVGPEAGMRQPVGTPDLMATLFELLTVLAILPLATARALPGPRRQRSGERPGERGALTYALVGGLSLYTLAFTAVAVVPAVTGHGSGTGHGSEPAAEAHGAGGSGGSQGHAGHLDAAAGAAPAQPGSGAAPGSAPAGANPDPGSGSGAASGSGSANSGSDAAPGSASVVTVNLTARQMSFGTRRLTIPAGRQVEVRLENLDDAPHNLSIYRDARFTDIVFSGDVAVGGGSQVYEFRSPPPGRYWFRCDVHPSMSGEVSFS